MNTLRACWKLTRIAAHMVHGLATVTMVFPKLSQAQKEQQIQAWARTLLAYAAIEFEVVDQPASGTAMLLASNHVSWLDVYVILATCPCRFIAKSEVRQWPLVGRLAATIGTLFIARQSPRDALRVVHQVSQHLQAGDTLAVFPEGTTSNGQQVLSFHANLFQAAIAADAPVHPVALRYEDVATGGHSVAPAYIDDDSLLGSIWRTLTAPRLRVVLRFGPLRHCDGRSRRQWAADAQAEVTALLAAQEPSVHTTPVHLPHGKQDLSGRR